MFFLKAIEFLTWMYFFSHECAPVTYNTTYIENVEVCNGPGYFTSFGEIGIAACSDTEIYIALPKGLTKTNSVHNMELILHK
jgi:hypothetical protein